MALRAFKCNPSLGGFGAETHSSHLNDGNNSNTAITNNGGGDAFPQIVKELVDNAVDACSVKPPPAGSDDDDDGNTNADFNGSSGDDGVYKRVRVRIEAEEFTTVIDDEKKQCESLDCLRVTVSDNGVGMENIDDCVMVFSSNKNASRTDVNADRAKKGGEAATKRGKSKNKKKRGNNKENHNEATADSSSGGDGYTSGRYGLGLTLCLLHAQHLVPGSVTCITSTTANSEHWMRSTYQVDMDADNVRCKKREKLAKENKDECGTIVSLLVPVSLYLFCSSW